MKFKRFLQIILCAVLWCIGYTPNIHAQNRPFDIKFRLAQNYEQGGDFETAVKLYEEASASDSTNPVILDALKRCYLQLKRYDDAVTLLQRSLRWSPKDIGLLAQLGSVYILKSEDTKAFETWETAIVTNPKSEMTYRLVGGAMIQSRLFERAIDLYKRARATCNSPTLFTTDIAYLYSVLMNYADATREYLNWMRQVSSQVGFVQASIASYTNRTEGLSATTSIVEEAVKNEPGNIEFQRLLSWLYMEGKHFDKAYGVYKLIDEKTNANGRELYNFAERALREKAYATATRAYQDIMNVYPKFELMAPVKFGYARSLEEAEESGDTLKLFGTRNPFSEHSVSESTSPFENALVAYKHVTTDYPNTELAARSYLQIALIKRDKLFDLEGSRAALEMLVNTLGNFSAVTSEGKLQLGDVYLAGGDLQKAEAQYRSLAENTVVINQQRDKAALRLAELYYFGEKFQDALTKLAALTSNPSSDVTNDALSLKIFIQENQQSSEVALKEYASADLLKRQHKLPEALTLFESIIKKYPKTDVVDDALLNVGDLLTQMGRYSDAVAAYGRMITDFPESIFLDRTLMKMGQVYQLGLSNNTKAVETYQCLLEKFPNSIFVNEARRRIRELRGDNI